MNLLNILLYASGNAQGQSTNGGLGSTLVFFGLMILVLWLFLIRPQQKRNKEEQKLRENLKKGDNLILTTFGAGFTWGAIYLKWGYNPQ